LASDSWLGRLTIAGAPNAPTSNKLSAETTTVQTRTESQRFADAARIASQDRALLELFSQRGLRRERKASLESAAEFGERQQKAAPEFHEAAFDAQCSWRSDATVLSALDR
jgi:hypothetical protein